MFRRLKLFLKSDASKQDRQNLQLVGYFLDTCLQKLQVEVLCSISGQGTKPGLHAHTLVSTGQADLDHLLGGGLPLGTVLVILEDAFSQHHNTLLK